MDFVSLGLIFMSRKFSDSISLGSILPDSMVNFLESFNEFIASFNKFGLTSFGNTKKIILKNGINNGTNIYHKKLTHINT